MTSRVKAGFAAFALLTAASALCGSAPITAAAASDPAIRLSGNPQQGALLRGVAPEGTLSLTLDGKPVQLAADRSFIIGFDRDQSAHATLAATLADGRRLAEDLTVRPRSWRIENIDVARRPEGPTEEYLRRREIEVKRIEAARAVSSPIDGWRQSFILPAHGRISGLFGSQRIYRGEPAAFHSGLDIAPGAGAQVRAPADGVVVLAGPPMLSLEGNLIIIDHGMGLNSAFLHLATQAVQLGQRVRQGDLIGTVGATGRATGPHLHWSVKWRDARIDPQTLVAP